MVSDQPVGALCVMANSLQVGRVEHHVARDVRSGMLRDHLYAASDHDQSLAEIRLRMPRWMAPRDEHLLAGALPAPNIVFDDGVSFVA